MKFRVHLTNGAGVKFYKDIPVGTAGGEAKSRIEAESLAGASKSLRVVKVEVK